MQNIAYILVNMKEKDFDSKIVSACEKAYPEQIEIYITAWYFFKQKGNESAAIQSLDKGILHSKNMESEVLEEIVSFLKA